MQYQGYTGIMEIDEEAGIIFGKVIGLRDVITFQGESVSEARKAFEESVDSYLEFCAGRGEEPEKPYSGKFVVRIKPEIHRALAIAAEADQTSLNALAEKLLSYSLIYKKLDFILEAISGSTDRDPELAQERFREPQLDRIRELGATFSKRSQKSDPPHAVKTEAGRAKEKVRRGKEVQ